MPADMISSVETSSPTLSRTGPSIVSDRGANTGNEAIFGPFSIAHSQCRFARQRRDEHPAIDNWVVGVGDRRVGDAQ